jgi:hypothetical protein
MKQLTAIVFLMLSTLVLTSCEEKVTFTSSLFCEFVSNTDPRGVFGNAGTYTFRDLSNVRRSDNIIDIYYLGTTLTLEGIYPGELMRGDVIRDLYIDVNGLGRFLLIRSLAVLRDDEHITITSRDDPEFRDFMDDVMWFFYQEGRIDISVYGEVTNNNAAANDVRMRVTIDNILDVTVMD